jgi:nicotinate-nucleotide pyrophosphorylase (carboxylating)
VIERDLRIRIGTDAMQVAERALAEDGPGDVTTRVSVEPDQFGTAVIEFRSDGVLAGTAYADAVTTACDLGGVIWQSATGSTIPAGTTVGALQGNLARILRAERPLLNLLQRAVGIATATRAYVDRVAGTHARILHTRKTAPGLRLLDVSAVLAGGGHLHRLDLSHTLMVKDNHWRALERSGRPLEEVLGQARAEGVADCHVEVESLDQLEKASSAGATRLLLDNQTPETVRQWAAIARARRQGIEIEATGGITLANVRGYAEAGADFISVGALTHSVKAADVSLEVTLDG